MVSTRKFSQFVPEAVTQVVGLTGGANARLESGVTPIAQQSEPSSSIADQVKAIDTPAAKPPRANAAATLPATGIAPRPAVAVVEASSAESKYTPPPGTVFLTEKQGPMIGRLFNKLKIVDRDERLSFLEDTFKHPFDSSKQLSKAEATELISELMTLAGEEQKPFTPSAPQQSAPPVEPHDYADDDEERPF